MYNYRVFLVCKGLFSLLFPPNKKCFVVLCRRLCVQTSSCLVAELSFMSEIANYFDHLTLFDATIWRVLKCKTGRDKSRCTVGEISGGGKQRFLTSKLILRQLRAHFSNTKRIAFFSYFPLPTLRRIFPLCSFKIIPRNRFSFALELPRLLSSVANFKFPALLKNVLVY